MRNKGNFILLHVILALYAMVDIFSKMAGEEVFFSPRFFFFYGLVLFGLVIYALLWQQVLKKISLVTAYANKSITVAWGIIWGYFIFNEAVTIQKAFGAIVIMIGVCIVVSSEYGENVEESNK